MRKLLMSILFLLSIESPSFSAGFNETELLLQLNNTLSFMNGTLTNLTESGCTGTTESTTQTVVLGGLIVAGHVIPPIWEHFVKPMGAMLVDMYKSCRQCCTHMHDDPLKTYIYEDPDVSDGSKHLLWSVFEAFNQEIESKIDEGLPLYRRGQMTQGDGYFYDFPRLHIEITRAMNNDAYLSFSAPTKPLSDDIISKFIGRIQPYAQQHMGGEKGFTDFLHKVTDTRAKGLISCHDIIDDDPLTSDSIKIELGVIMHSNEGSSVSDIEAVDVQPHYQFSSRYRIVATAYDMDEYRQAPQSLRKKNKLKKVKVDRDSDESNDDL